MKQILQRSAMLLAVAALWCAASTVVIAQNGAPAQGGAEAPKGNSESLFYSKERPLLPPSRNPDAATTPPAPTGVYRTSRDPNLPDPRMPVAPQPEQTPAPVPTNAVPGNPTQPAPPARIIQGVNNGEAEKKPMGATASATRANAYTIEDELRPERVPVFPKDPDSAWWEINPRIAFLRAQREQKPLLLLFTGDWNAKAMNLSEEVFSTKSFNEFVKENLVICYLNYPQNITDAPMSLRNVKEKFKVRGYPNVLIFNPQGEVDHQIPGYRTGRPVDYFNRLKQQLWPIQERIRVRKRGLAQHGFRDWEGGEKHTTIFAKFIKRDPDLVTLKGVNGEEWTVTLKTLSEEDRAIAESFPTIDEVVNIDQVAEVKKR